MSRYIALLRGINVGGNKKVPMADLKKLLEKAGFEHVKTLLNTGNVLFESEEKDLKKIQTLFETSFEKKFGFTSHVILRKESEIQALLDSDPFKKIVVKPETRLYITFLSEKPTSKLKIPYVSPEKDFEILNVTNGEIISVLTVKNTMNTTEGMKILEKEFGKNITTRNWNTVQKLLK